MVKNTDPKRNDKNKRPSEPTFNQKKLRYTKVLNNKTDPTAESSDFSTSEILDLGAGADSSDSETESF